MTRHAQAERQALADLLLEVGPEAPTCCEGWAAADLAAHLVVRERRPDAAVGILVPPLASYTDRVQRHVRDGRSWPDLVAAVRAGPPLALRLLDEAINTVEYFVHHEDVRRAGDHWEPRDLEPSLELVLWQRLRTAGRVLFRRAGVGVDLEASRTGTATARSGPDPVKVVGPAGELLLFAFGRGAHARVELVGSPAATARLREANLGL